MLDGRPARLFRMAGGMGAACAVLARCGAKLVVWIRHLWQYFDNGVCSRVVSRTYADGWNSGDIADWCMPCLEGSCICCAGLIDASVLPLPQRIEPDAADG